MANKVKKYLKGLILLSGLVLIIGANSMSATQAASTTGATGKTNSYKFVAAWPSTQWLFKISDIAADSKGNFYIADTIGNRIKTYSPDGKLLAQWATGATDTPLSPIGYKLAVDKDGFIYVADGSNNRIRKFNAQGKLRAQWGSKGKGDGQFSNMGAIAVDGSGYMYVIDGSRIQKFDYRGRFVAKWGKNGGDGSDGNGQGEFSHPIDIAVDKSGNVYVSDAYNNRIQKLTPDGKFITQFGNFKVGKGIAAMGDSPSHIALDKDGNVYVVDVTYNTDLSGIYGCYIQKYTSDGKFVAKFGDYISEISSTNPNSPGVNGIALDGIGDIYTANEAAGQQSVEKFNVAGKKLAQWGKQSTGNARFKGPSDVAVDNKGNVYVADRGNNRVQKLDSSGKYITQWGGSGYGKGKFDSPRSVAVDKNGDVYVSDFTLVQKFTAKGKFITQWGGIGPGKGKFGGLTLISIATSNKGSVYVADPANHLIQMFNLKGKFIKQWGAKGAGKGKFGDSSLDIAVDGKTNVYVADVGNNLVQKFDANGKYLTQWEGYGTNLMGSPGMIGITADDKGNVYVADCNENFADGRIQKFDTNGKHLMQIGSGGTDDGLFYFGFFGGLAIDAKGKLFVADTGNNRIQVFLGT